MESVPNSPQASTGNALRDNVRQEMQRLGMSQSRLSRESGINAARLSQWLADKYTGNNDLIEQELSRWLSALHEREKSMTPLSLLADWRPTPTGNSIVNALRYAQDAGDISLVYGGAGVGKTCTAKRYQEDNPNVWIATMTPTINTVAACMERVGMSVGLPEIPASAVKTENAIVARLNGTKGLLVVDETQHLPVSGLEALRSIHDASGCGLVLMGNESVYARITGGSRQAAFAQLFSRVGYRLRLGTPSSGDVETLIAAWKVTEKKARHLCLKIASQAGALRGLIKVLRLASAMLVEGDEALSVDHIQTAWADQGGNL